MKTSLCLTLILGSILMIFVSCKSETKKNKSTKRPNIVFIMSDDHAYQAISAYSNKLIQTPNIDRIAKEGMLFTNASVTNSICAPSRAVILTGKHSHINGKIDNLSPFDTTNITFPQLLQNAGYQTAMFGKLHFGNNPKGFDEFKILPGQGDYYNPTFNTKQGDTTIVGYVTDIITDLTLDWLEKRRDTARPFLLMHLHKAPHRSWLPAERHYKEFTKKTFPVPETLFDDYTTRGDAARTAEMNILEHMVLNYDNKVSPEIIEELNIKDRKLFDPLEKKDYLGTIAAVDENVGRLLDYLDKTGLSENTLVVYTSDQGFYLGEHGWFDKRFMYEESFKTPLLIKWPHVINAGITEDQMVQNLDFAQTFLQVAGVLPPSDMQGESLVPLLKGQKEKWKREAVYYHYYEYPAEHAVKRHYGIATKDYKLIHFYYDVDEWELYDRKNDKLEVNNVYQDPKYSNVVSEMKQKLKEVRLKYKDSDSLSNQYIKLYKEKGWID